MSLAAHTPMPDEPERRNFQRVHVKLYGRFMLEDRTEHPCQVIDMSPGSVSLRTDEMGEPGEKCIVYLDHIGRLEGVITRTFPDGFALTVVASERKKDKLAAQLTWLANKHELDLPQDRRHERVAPRNPMSVLHLMDGRQYECRIIALSLSAAAIAFGGGATVDGVVAMLQNFSGLPHRLELIGSADGITWYNDSKATVPHATVVAVSGFE